MKQHKNLGNVQQKPFKLLDNCTNCKWDCRHNSDHKEINVVTLEASLDGKSL